MNFSILSVFLAIGILLNPLMAGEDAPRHELSQWKFGETLFGDQAAPSTLKGKVVVLQYWGVSCQSCLKGMDGLVKLDRDYGKKGLRVVAAEMYRSGKSQIADVVKSQKIDFSVTDGVSGPVSISGLPHSVVFGSDGKMIFSGHPNEPDFKASIQRAMEVVKEEVRLVKKAEVTEQVLIEERTWTNNEGKPLSAAVTEIEGGKVTFRLKDGRLIPYEISNLSKQDQEFLKTKTAGE